MCPLLIQDAAADPKFKDHPAVRLGLTRYLGVPIHSPDGAAVGTLCFLDNRSQERLHQEDVEFLTVLAMRVSAERERERITEQRLEEERATAARLGEAVDRLVQAAEEKRRLTATVIHDLRQPLATMRTALYLLEREDTPAERAECREVLESRVHALDALVDELMEYARIEAGQVPSQLEEAELFPMLEDYVRPFVVEAAPRSVEVRLEVDASLGSAQTDRTKLCHIVRNLLSNGIKFAARNAPGESGDRERARGLVAVRAAGEGPSAWRLEVEDDGIGMPETVQRHIFEEFYQGPEALAGEARSGSPRGRGLGLAIVKHLCSALKAEIQVRSAPGEGTCFSVLFPRSL